MITINLIAERRAKRLREMTVLRMSGIGIAIVFVFAILLNLIVFWNLRTQKNNLIEATSDLKFNEEKRKNLQILLDAIDDRKPVVTLLEQAQISEGAWMTIMADISRVIPHDVALKDFMSIASGGSVSLRLSAYARDEQTVGQFMQSFNPDDTPWAQTPTLVTLTAQEDPRQHTKRVQFEMTVPVKGLMGGDL